MDFAFWLTIFIKSTLGGRLLGRASSRGERALLRAPVARGGDRRAEGGGGDGGLHRDVALPAAERRPDEKAPSQLEEQREARGARAAAR